MSTEETQNTEANEKMAESQEVDNAESTEENKQDESSKQDESKELSELEKLKQENAKYKRLLNKETKKEGEEDKAEAQPAVSPEDITRLEIKSEGYKAKEDIEYIVSIMNRTGDDLDSVLNDEFVQNKLKVMKEQRNTENATPSSTKQGESREESPERLIKRVEKDPSLYSQLTKEQRQKIRKAKSGRRY